MKCECQLGRSGPDMSMGRCDCAERDRKTDLYDLVKAAISNAKENGYGGALSGYSDEQMAIDIMDCDADVQAMKPELEDVIELVKVLR